MHFNFRLGKSGSMRFRSPYLPAIPRGSFLLILALVFLLGPCVVSLTAQNKLTESQWKRGYHGFGVIAEGLDLKLYERFDRWQTGPADESILIVLGTETESTRDRERLWLLSSSKIDRYLNNGGAVMVATDADYTPGRRQSMAFVSSPTEANNVYDSFQGFLDCPIVTNLKLPYLSGVKTVVTNRPGRLVNRGVSWDTLGYLPTCNGEAKQEAFAVGGERNGAKLICFCDQSIFSNQMLPHGDNALLAKATLEFLKGENRKRVMILENGRVMLPFDPSNLNVELPQPTGQEVVDAMKELPPSAILDFVNSVLGAVEDENLVNQFVREQVDQIRPEKVNRFLIFCAFGLGCFVATGTYLFQKKLKRTTSSDIAYGKAEQLKSHQKKIASSHASKSKLYFERQMAVLALLDNFCIERVDRRFNDLKRFPDELGVGDDEHGKAIKQAMKTIHDDFKSKSRDFWTTKRLLGVENAIKHWNQYFKLDPGLRERESGNGSADKNENVVEAKIVD